MRNASEVFCIPTSIPMVARSSTDKRRYLPKKYPDHIPTALTMREKGNIVHTSAQRMPEPPYSSPAKNLMMNNTASSTTVTHFSRRSMASAHARFHWCRRMPKVTGMMVTMNICCMVSANESRRSASVPINSDRARFTQKGMVTRASTLLVTVMEMDSAVLALIR